LAQPLAHDQAAPYGWLVLVKLATIAFGMSEYALRLVPLISGLASLAIIYPLSKRFLGPAASLVCCLLVATTHSPIHWSVMVKPYATDLLIAIAILTIAARMDWWDLNRTSTAGLAAVGALAVWFSFPAVFILGTVAVYALLLGSATSGPRQLVRLIGIALAWMLSFATHYGLVIHASMQSSSLRGMWEPFFASLPALNSQSMANLFESVTGFFSSPVGVPVEYGGFVLFLLGTAALLTKAPEEAFLLLGPAVLAYFASVAGLYPIFDRLLLFLVPSFQLLIASGIERVSRGVARLGWLPVAGLVFVLVFPSTRYGISLGVSPQPEEEMRPVAEYVLRKLQPGDAIYVYYAAASQWQYYIRYFGASEPQYLIATASPGNPDRYLQEISGYLGERRVWLVFSHDQIVGGESEVSVILEQLGCIGTEIGSFEAPQAWAYLYDMTKPSVECGAK
ncbi:MAG TPA: hypothetical protein VGC99_09825, partial [Candidatus Tectomicrobia bacterium]